MIYVTSDIHGCFDQYLRLTERLNLNEDDRLYILGDIVDRGGGGIEIIKDVMKRENVVCLRGNHDYYALIFLKRFALQDPGTEDRLKDGPFPRSQSSTITKNDPYLAFLTPFRFIK